jgi:CRP-like cAMP-binding protein
MNDDYARLLLEEVRRMRALLELIAEPAVAQRDAKLRDELRKIVGSSSKKQRSVFLMDGSLTQAQIATQSTLDQGDLSKLAGKLENAGLIVDGRKQPKLAISIPSNFFEANAKIN